MKIFIPSFNRAVALPAVAYFKDTGLEVTLVVAQSQRAAYEAANPGIAIVTVPDSQDGNIARKRNAILEMIRGEPDGAGYMVDDDMARLVRCRDVATAKSDLSGKTAQEIYNLENVSPAEAGNLMNQLTQKARNEGAVYFGFNNTRNYRKFDPATPFSTDAFFSAVMGIIAQPDMQFDESLARGSSIDFFLTQRARVLRDNRYALDRPRLEGGIQVSRSARKADLATLADRWGRDVVVLSFSGSAVLQLHPEAVGA